MLMNSILREAFCFAFLREIRMLYLIIVKLFFMLSELISRM